MNKASQCQLFTTKRSQSQDVEPNHANRPNKSTRQTHSTRRKPATLSLGDCGRQAASDTLPFPWKFPLPQPCIPRDRVGGPPPLTGGGGSDSRRRVGRTRYVDVVRRCRRTVSAVIGGGWISDPPVSGPNSEAGLWSRPSGPIRRLEPTQECRAVDRADSRQRRTYTNADRAGPPRRCPTGTDRDPRYMSRKLRKFRTDKFNT